MSTIRFRGAALLAFALMAGGPLPSVAQQPPGGSRFGAVLGTVTNSATGEPVPAATVRLLELGRSELSHEGGEFHFDRIPAGSYRVAVQRLGFAPAEQTITLSPGSTARVQIALSPSVVTIPGLVVTGTGRARSAQDAYRPTTVLDEAELRRRLGSSIAATLSTEPGISQRYNGPAAAQPVIRGLSGDRVLVLEDGNRTGDIAATSADHAVAIEPLTAERIEVLRGPAGLLYGSNALGGVINVVREEVPRTLPESMSGTISAQVESVNSGLSGGGSVLTSFGPLALRGELSGRTAGDTRTPRGVLPSTGLDGYNAGAGASWVRGDGFVGAAVRDFSMRYGVPGSFGGVLIPGGHEGGVTIDLRRTALRGDAALFPGAGPFSSFELDGQYVRFSQEEIEEGGRVGTRFGQLTASGNFMAHHRHEVGPGRTEGTIGLSALWQDHRSSGAGGSAPAQQTTLAAFGFEELSWATFRFQVGARFDWSRILPLEDRASLIGDLREREFGAVSGSVATLYEPRDNVVFGVSVSRAFRTPSITELFSNGPHLADFSFNIGNPELDPEFGLGFDLFTRASLPRLSGEMAVYRNRISNYIYYAPTGRLDPRLNRFPVYQARGDDATLWGAEGRVQWEALRRVVVDATASAVRGRRDGDGRPLPAIPPLRAALTTRYDTPRYFVSAGGEVVAEQRRVGEFESPTEGHALLNLGAGLRWTTWGNLQTLTLQVRNLTDATWYDHLSRIKAVAPQPGRNVELLYRVSF